MTQPNADASNAMQRTLRTTNALLTIIAAVLLGAVLKAAKVVVLPATFAVFLAIILRPLLTWLSRFVRPVFSIGIVFAGLLGMLTGLWAFLSASVGAVAQRGPYYLTQIQARVVSTMDWLHERGIPIPIERFTAEEVLKIALQAFGASILPIFSVLAFATLVAFMLALLLLEMEGMRRAVAAVDSGNSPTGVVATLDTIFRKFQTYFFTKTAISLATGLLTTVFLWLVGVDFPLIWGTLAFMLNYLPNIGSTIAVFPPVLVAFVQFEGFSVALVTFVGLLGIQLSIGNFLDPRIMGRSLQLSPFVVFCSMVFWGWMWGVPGIFLAVPLTVGLQIAFSSIPPLRPLAAAMRGAAHVNTGNKDDDAMDSVVALQETNPAATQPVRIAVTVNETSASEASP